MILGFKKKIGKSPTFFKEKILSSLGVKEYKCYTPKLHTIREDLHGRWSQKRIIQACYGVRTKQFEKFSTMPCLGIQTIEIKHKFDAISILVDGKILDENSIVELSKNDGFDTFVDFLLWFNKDFEGKIIHWTDKKY